MPHPCQVGHDDAIGQINAGADLHVRAQCHLPAHAHAPLQAGTAAQHRAPRQQYVFQRQARDFAAAVKAAGKPVELLVGDDYNHFEIFETLATPYGLLGRAVLEQMQLSQGANA